MIRTIRLIEFDTWLHEEVAKARETSHAADHWLRINADVRVDALSKAAMLLQDFLNFRQSIPQP